MIADPKLKQARAEIEAILKRYDIAAFCVLHNAPGNGEIFADLSPSYSRVTGVLPEVRVRIKREDYGSDMAAWGRDAAVTANLISFMGKALGSCAMPLLELSKIIDAKLGAEHGIEHHQPDSPKGAP